MKKLFAVPVIDGKLCEHFGHCNQFAVVQTEGQRVIKVEYLSPPVHQPGTYPKFLAEKGVKTIIAGGLGMKAKQIFEQHNIEVIMGVQADKPEVLVESYLQHQLVSGENLCDH